MRRQLAIMAAATTSMVALAFLIPLAILVQTVVRDRALNAAELEARSLAPLLATQHDPAILESAIDAVSGGGAGQVTVYLADGTVLGRALTPDANVAVARRGRAFSTPIGDSTAVFLPVLGSDGSTVVVEVVVVVVCAVVDVGGQGSSVVVVVVVVVTVLVDCASAMRGEHHRPSRPMKADASTIP